MTKFVISWDSGFGISKGVVDVPTKVDAERRASDEAHAEFESNYKVTVTEFNPETHARIRELPNE